MKNSFIGVTLLSFICIGCSSHLAVIQQGKNEHSHVMQQIRQEIADVKHGLNNTQVELQILEEQYRIQENSSSKGDTSKVAALEKKIVQISSHANQLSQSLTDCHEKIANLEKIVEHQQALLAEVGHLKGSLSTVIHSLQKEAASVEIRHKVKSGDSLEKIARMHKVSINALKEENNLSSDKIVVGQELRIPGSN